MADLVRYEHPRDTKQQLDSLEKCYQVAGVVALISHGRYGADSWAMRRCCRLGISNLGFSIAGFP